jgi:hypothetical protein
MQGVRAFNGASSTIAARINCLSAGNTPAIFRRRTPATLDNLFGDSI